MKRIKLSNKYQPRDATNWEVVQSSGDTVDSIISATDTCRFTTAKFIEVLRLNGIEARSGASRVRQVFGATFVYCEVKVDCTHIEKIEAIAPNEK